MQQFGDRNARHHKFHEMEMKMDMKWSRRQLTAIFTEFYGRGRETAKGFPGSPFFINMPKNKTNTLLIYWCRVIYEPFIKYCCWCKRTSDRFLLKTFFIEIVISTTWLLLTDNSPIFIENLIFIPIHLEFSVKFY